MKDTGGKKSFMGHKGERPTKAFNKSKSPLTHGKTDGSHSFKGKKNFQEMKNKFNKKGNTEKDDDSNRNSNRHKTDGERENSNKPYRYDNKHNIKRTSSNASNNNNNTTNEVVDTLTDVDGDDEIINKSKEQNAVKDEVAMSIDRIKQVNLNQKISQHANRKELQQAYELYQEALQEDLANSHTFGAMVNAAVRCGNMTMVEQVISTMLSKGRKLKDVVLYTTLMKGYCAQGNLTKALKLYQDMLKKRAVVQPNIRTINTLLRGCVQMGEIYIAEILFQQMQKELSIKPDVSSWEYVITLLSQGLLVDKILPMNGRMKSDASLSSGMISVNVNLARAAALSGEYKLAKKCLQQVSTLLEAPITVEGNDGEIDGDSEPPQSASTNVQKTVVGGKRAWKSNGADSTLSVDEKRNQSLILYREHIREEWKQEAETLSKFIDDRLNSSSSSQASTSSALEFLYPFYFRMLSFDSNLVYATDDSTGSIFSSVGVHNPVVVKDVRDQVFYSLCYKFGLDALVKKASGHHITELLQTSEGEGKPKQQQQQQSSSKSSSSNKKGSNGMVSLADLINSPPTQPQHSKSVDKTVCAKFMDEVRTLKTAVESYFDDNGFLDFQKVFPSFFNAKKSEKNGNGKCDQSPALVKLEICSGAGEWAVTQAKNDPTSPWMTLELRHDRVYQTVTKMIYSEVKNMCVLGGDAMLVLPRHVRNNSVGHIFVNHPEPPQQTGGETSEGHHLLNEAFFKEAERVLAENGMCTIITDNVWYGKFLCRLLSTQTSLCLRSLTAKDATLINPSWLIHHEVENFVLWVGEPGKEAGHGVDASSYFDRLWKRGQLQDRYFLVLVKNSNYIRPRPVKVPLKIPAVTVKKSIKFDDADDDEDSHHVTTANKDCKKESLVEESVESILKQIKTLEESDPSLTTVSDTNEKKKKHAKNNQAFDSNSDKKRKPGDALASNNNKDKPHSNGQKGASRCSDQPDQPKKKRF